MASLEDCHLEVGGARFAASEPLAGDGTLEPDGHDRELTCGVRATEAPELASHIGEVARVTDRSGEVIARLRVKKVEPSLSVMVGELVH